MTDEQILKIAREACRPFPWGTGTTREIFLDAVRAVLAAGAPSVADAARAKAVVSVGAHLWMPSDIPAPTEAPQDFGDRKAYAFKAPGADEHDPWYVVLPNMNALKLGYHADDSIDRQHAEFIAAAINRAIAATPASSVADAAGAKRREASIAGDKLVRPRIDEIGLSPQYPGIAKESGK